MDDNALAELLVQKELLSEKQLAKARELMETLGQKGRLGEIVVRLGYLTESQLKRIREEQKKKEVDLSRAEVDINTLTLVPEEFLRKNVAIPLKHGSPGKILLAMASSADLQTVESIQFMTNSLVETVYAPKENILAKLDDYFSFSESKRMTKIELVKGEETVLDEPPAILTRALTELLIEKGIVDKGELFIKVSNIKDG